LKSTQSKEPQSKPYTKDTNSNVTISTFSGVIFFEAIKITKNSKKTCL